MGCADRDQVRRRGAPPLRRRGRRFRERASAPRRV